MVRPPLPRTEPPCPRSPSGGASLGRGRLEPASGGRLRRLRQRRTARGFTLMELLAVLAVISILAAIGTPAFIEMFRERRTQHETALIADAFRTARARSLGRGAAVRVLTTANPPGAQIEELVTDMDGDGTIEPDQGDGLPVPSCRANGLWRPVGRLQGRPGASLLRAYIPGETPADETADELEFGTCYTPRGRTYYTRESGFASWLVLDGVVDLRVKRADGLGDHTFAGARSVFVMPNGQTRLGL